MISQDWISQSTRSISFPYTSSTTGSPIPRSGPSFPWTFAPSYATHRNNVAATWDDATAKSYASDSHSSSSTTWTPTLLYYISTDTPYVPTTTSTHDDTPTPTNVYHDTPSVDEIIRQDRLPVRAIEIPPVDDWTPDTNKVNGLDLPMTVRSSRFADIRDVTGMDPLQVPLWKQSPQCVDSQTCSWPRSLCCTPGHHRHDCVCR